MNPIQLSNYLSSIIWTASKLQEQITVHTIYTPDQVATLRRIDDELDTILTDRDENHYPINPREDL